MHTWFEEALGQQQQQQQQQQQDGGGDGSKLRRKYITVGGSQEERLQSAIAAIEPLLSFPPLFLPPAVEAASAADAGTRIGGPDKL